MVIILKLEICGFHVVSLMSWLDWSKTNRKHQFDWDQSCADVTQLDRGCSEPHSDSLYQCWGALNIVMAFCIVLRIYYKSQL